MRAKSVNIIFLLLLFCIIAKAQQRPVLGIPKQAVLSSMSETTGFYQIQGSPTRNSLNYLRTGGDGLPALMYSFDNNDRLIATNVCFATKEEAIGRFNQQRIDYGFIIKISNYRYQNPNTGEQIDLVIYYNESTGDVFSVNISYGN